MLVEELDVAIVDPFCDLFSYLLRKVGTMLVFMSHALWTYTPTCGDLRSIMFRRAHRFSVSAPDDAPTKRLYLSLPCKSFFSTWSARAVGIFLRRLLAMRGTTITRQLPISFVVFLKTQNIGAKLRDQ